MVEYLASIVLNFVMDTNINITPERKFAISIIIISVLKMCFHLIRFIQRSKAKVTRRKEIMWCNIRQCKQWHCIKVIKFSCYLDKERWGRNHEELLVGVRELLDLVAVDEDLLVTLQYQHGVTVLDAHRACAGGWNVGNDLHSRSLKLLYVIYTIFSRLSWILCLLQTVSFSLL